MCKPATWGRREMRVLESRLEACIVVWPITDRKTQKQQGLASGPTGRKGATDKEWEQEMVISCSSVFCYRSEFTPSLGLCCSLLYHFCTSHYVLWLRIGQLYPFIPPKKAVSKLNPYLSDRLQIQGRDERGSICPQTEKEGRGRNKGKQEKRGQKYRARRWFGFNPCHKIHPSQSAPITAQHVFNTAHHASRPAAVWCFVSNRGLIKCSLCMIYPTRSLLSFPACWLCSFQHTWSSLSGRGLMEDTGALQATECLCKKNMHPIKAGNESSQLTMVSKHPMEVATHLPLLFKSVFPP